MFPAFRKKIITFSISADFAIKKNESSCDSMFRCMKSSLAKHIPEPLAIQKARIEL